MLKFCSMGLAVGMFYFTGTASFGATQSNLGTTGTQGSSSVVLSEKSGSTSRKNMVASVHPLATQAGIDAFSNGGNAIDAAIATALTLGVVDNFNSGIGGGCFILIRTAKGEVYAIDGRETW